MESTQARYAQLGWWLAIAAISGTLLYFLSPILAPFLAAGVLAYIFKPLVARMSRRVPRTLAVAIAMALIAGVIVVLLLILLPLIGRQLKSIAGQVPQFIDWIRLHLGPLVQQHFGVELDTALLKDWLIQHTKEIQSVALSLLPTLRSGGLALLEFFANLVLVPVVLFYFMRDWDRMIERAAQLIPRDWSATVSGLLGEIDDVLGESLRGQLLVMLLMAAFYSIGLWLVGLDYALSVGLISGFLTFVPYLSVIIGVLLATLTGLLQFGEFTPLLWIWLVFVIANVLEGNVLVPWLVGERIGLHPVAVIFALLAFGQLFGFAGVLLALPASAALLVWLRHVRVKYLASGMYQGDVKREA
ncbi:MAG: AI-2E family transporter [Betaproteobacteria bacterium]|nr:AI-2E family transporter [Betaproteobacteria bacterium]